MFSDRASATAWARFGGVWARDLVEVRRGVDTLADLDSGWWAVVGTFEGEWTALRFATTSSLRAHGPVPARWRPLSGPWRTSLDEQTYRAAVTAVRDQIAAGTVYQVNICRVLSHLLPESADLGSLARLIEDGNPAPYAGSIVAPQAGIEVVCASPEIYLGRQGAHIASGPIKGTAATIEQMLAKDYAENVMIVDLVRNDLSAVCRPGTVSVDRLCAVEQHPGLVHLVSEVSGTLTSQANWPEILAATFPPGSVSGAPKHTALAAIDALETAPRGPYCGAIGWLDADRDQASLAVGIRTFWVERDSGGQRWLKFGAGSGITYDSDPGGEWSETELKARHLIGLVGGL